MNKVDLIGRKIFISKDIVDYIQAKKIFEDVAVEQLHSFSIFYKDEVKSFEQLIAKIKNRMRGIINIAIEKSIELLVFQNQLRHSVQSFYVKYSNDYFNLDEYLAFIYILKQEIEAKKNNISMERAINRGTRTKWVGGGFGVTGAIKGAMTASVMNTGSTLIRGVFDSIQDSGDNYYIQSLKNKALGEDTYYQLLEVVYKCIMGVFFAYIHETRNSILNIDIAGINNKFSNIKKYIKDEKKAVGHVLECIAEYPLNIEYYMYLIDLRGDTDNSIELFCRNIGYEKEIREYKKEKYLKSALKLSEDSTTEIEDKIEIIKKISEEKNIDVDKEISFLNRKISHKIFIGKIENEIEDVKRIKKEIDGYITNGNLESIFNMIKDNAVAEDIYIRYILNHKRLSKKSEKFSYKILKKISDSSADNIGALDAIVIAEFHLFGFGSFTFSALLEKIWDMDKAYKYYELAMKRGSAYAKYVVGGGNPLIGVAKKIPMEEQRRLIIESLDQGSPSAAYYVSRECEKSSSIFGEDIELSRVLKSYAKASGIS